VIGAGVKPPAPPFFVLFTTEALMNISVEGVLAARKGVIVSVRFGWKAVITDGRARPMKIGPSAKSVIASVAVGSALGVVISFPALFAAVISGGAGHGDYAAARMLFPAPMLLTLLDHDTIGAFSIGIGLLQFPVYGALLGWSVARKNYLPAFAVTTAHIIAAVACFAGTLPNFS